MAILLKPNKYISQLPFSGYTLKIENKLPFLCVVFKRMHSVNANVMTFKLKKAIE